ncbi:unnamed protein product, partial [Vitis vinifera]
MATRQTDAFNEISAWLHAFSLLFATSVSYSPVEVSYRHHCDSIVPESTPTSPEFTSSLLPRSQTGYSIGPDTTVNRNLSRYFSRYSSPVSFYTRNIYKTKTEGVFKVEGRLRLFLPWSLKYSQLSYPHLQGFWSESSGKLCMVGSGSSRSREGNWVPLSAILKLINIKNSSTITHSVSGTLESLSSVNDFDYFEPITILLFPQMNYKYTLVPEENDTGSTGRHNVPERSSPDTGLITGICSILRRGYPFELEYAHHCNSSHICTPFGGDIEYLPHIISTEVIQCSEYERRSLVLVKFQSDEHYQPFHPNMTLVGEGWWDAKKSRLSVVACRLSNLKNSLANAQVGDCSVRLSLRFNTIWSIRNMSMMLGQIWSNKTVNESGYFERIAFQSTQNVMLEVRGFKYEYTETDRARSLCQIKKPAGNKGVAYPNGYSSDMQFHMSVKNSKGVMAWGFSAPFVVDYRLYKPYQYAMPLSINSKSSVPVSRPMPANRVVEANTMEFEGFVSSLNSSSLMHTQVEISAEGIYNARTGGLCMVGCRKLSLMTRLSTNDSMDCEILVNFQFPPLNSKKGHIKGTIKSRREKSDPLYFEHLDLSSTSYTVVEAKQSIWRMDLEIFMVLISNTLSCVFLGLQLFYVKNQPDVLPSISLLMLVILTLGYMVPLVLNFEALFLQNHARQNVLLESGGWLKVNEVIVRVVTMVVFLLQFRLLQLTWSAKCGAENQKGLWVAEKNALYVSLPSYILGCLISLSLNRTKTEYGAVKGLKASSSLISYQQHSHWQDLRSYAGLTLDGFLFPQIILNMFISSRDEPLSCWFYMGTTLVRLLPHAYDLFRAHNYVSGFNGSFLYANPGADFYSTSWDVIIPCVALLFAAIIFLQQRFGGRCILPRRFKDLEAYEKVPVASSEFTGFKVGYFTGGTAILGQNSSPYSSQSSKSLSFRTRSLYATETEGVFKVEGRLVLASDRMYYFEGDLSHGRPSFPQLQGFWSESSGELCMVGLGSAYSNGGNLLRLSAVLKLSNVKNSSTITDLVTGTLKSLNSAHDSNYFEPISILIFPEMNYKYTLASSGTGCPGGADVPETASLSTDSMNSICSILSMERFGLEYAHDCNPSQNCSPFGGGIGYLPQFISITEFQCSEDEERLQVMVKFQNSSYDYYRTYNPSTTLIGEGSWDVNKNQLCLVACRILNEGDSLVDARIGDCSIKLSLRFPAILSIRNRSTVVGQIWSDKTVNDPGFFSKIMFQSIRNRMPGIPGSKYEYTEIERARKLCLKKKPAEKKGVAYPNGYSSDMQLDMSVRNSTHLMGWAYSELITLGDSLTLEPGVKFGDMIISPSNFSGIYTPVEISAEGIYDAKTGFLCMVGCRKLSSPVKTSSNDSMDCEILVNLQFPQLNSKNRGYIKGSIQSTREKSDPLYFEHLDLSANSFFGARQSIWRMDFEIIMVLISHTLSCVFVGLQLFYVKKHSEVLPSISLVMLVVLTLGYMIPLVLNFEALFLGSHDQRNALLESGGWIKANEVIVRIVTMVVFLLQFRLLQLTWAAKLKEAGCLIALFFNRGKNEYGAAVQSYSLPDYQQHSLWGDLRSYAGLVLDGFLFPQILLNMFTSSTVKALSHSFYVGTTFVRLLPHTYDLYRAHNNAISFNGSYIYANPGADFYSTAWDVIIPCGGLLFSAIIFLQQRFGGRCILPKRFRELEAYEKIPVKLCFLNHPLNAPFVL